MKMPPLKRKFKAQLYDGLMIRRNCRTKAGIPSDATPIGTMTFDTTSSDFYIATTTAAAGHVKLD